MEGSPWPYGTDLGSAGNCSTDVSREEASVPGPAGSFAASREAAYPQGSGREAASQRMLVELEGWISILPPPQPHGAAAVDRGV